VRHCAALLVLTRINPWQTQSLTWNPECGAGAARCGFPIDRFAAVGNGARIRMEPHDSKAYKFK